MQWTQPRQSTAPRMRVSRRHCKSGAKVARATAQASGKAYAPRCAAGRNRTGAHSLARRSQGTPHTTSRALRSPRCNALRRLATSPREQGRCQLACAQPPLAAPREPSTARREVRRGHAVDSQRSAGPMPAATRRGCATCADHALRRRERRRRRGNGGRR